MKTGVDTYGSGIDLYGYMCGYDVQGRLLFKDSPNGGDYLWDGWRMVKKQAWPWGGFGETVEYVWGRDLSGTMEGAGGVGGLLAVRVDGAWHFPLYDHNGNITAYVSESGAVSAEYEYDPFGKVIAHTGRDFDFQFSTKFHDPDIDMYYYGYRYYSPELRRWASPDPIGEAGGLNLYGFCGNSPVDQCDMWGLIEVTEIPEIMRANSWTEGADLMEKWLSAPVNTTTTVAAPSVDIVKMNWVLGFANAKSKYEEIFSKKLYATEAARREIKKMVILTRFGTDGRFCDLSRSVLDVEKDYVTHQAVPSDKTLDGLTAALGGFSFHIAVSGIVKNNCAYIDSVGVYVHDRYDFIDRGFREKWIRSQDLGAWNKNTKTVSYWFGGDSVNNKTFRKYQKNTLKGGDFDIFSDIKIRYLNQDERFSIQLDKE